MAKQMKAMLNDLIQQPGNDICCDCGLPDPEWASYNIGVFLCETCAGLHRHLGSHISKIKSIKLDKWDEEQVKQMENLGNLASRTKYEEFVPACYRRPKHDDPMVLKEQWIRSKYERLEFTDIEQQKYLSGNMSGYLWKRGKADKKFNKRKFVLDESENVLKYFVKDDAKDAKAALRIDDINIALVPDKIGNPNAMQIVFEKDQVTRSLYVYSEDPVEMVHWYNAVRCAKLNRLRIAYPGTPDEELTTMLAHDFAKEGWLHKKGPNNSDAYRRRWITLDKRKIWYSETQTDAFPKGEIFIGTEATGFKVKDGVPPDVKDPGFSFTLTTPRRSYHLAAETEIDKKDWMMILRNIIGTPLSPQDASNLARN